MSIHELVQQALKAGSLSIEAESQLRQQLQRTRYGIDDVRAFATLQQATMSGKVRQQSRQYLAMVRP